MFIIEATKMTPQVVLDPNENSLSLSGKLFPSNAAEFFDPLFELVEKHLAKSDRLIINVSVTYLNSAATKMLLRLFERVAEISESGKSAQINWYHDEMDDDMKEIGEDLNELVSLPVVVIVNEKS